MCVEWNIRVATWLLFSVGEPRGKNCFTRLNVFFVQHYSGCEQRCVGGEEVHVGFAEDGAVTRGRGEAVERGNSKLNKTNFSIEFTEGGRKIINFHLRIFD